MRRCAIRLAFAALLGATTGASAQSLPTLVNPSSPLERVPVPNAQEGSGGFIATPGSGGDSEAPAGSDTLMISVNAIAIVGSTVYGDDDLAPLTAPLIGQTVPAARLFEVAKALTARYRDDGYVLSRAFVPEQRVSDGKFEIRVVEGYISKVRIQGEVGPVVDQIAAYLEHITDERPITIQTLERYLLLVRDLPGIDVRGTLRPTTGAAGARELVADVTHTLYGGFVSYDNRGSRFLGPGEATAGFHFNSLTELGERIDLLYFNTFSFTQPTIVTRLDSTDEQQFGQLTFTTPVGSDGLTIKAYAGSGPAAPGGTLKLSHYESSLVVAGIGLSYPVLRARAFNLSFSTALELQNSSVYVQNSGTGLPVENNVSDLRIVRSFVTADLNDGWGGRNTFQLGGHKGIPVFGANDPVNPRLPPRPGNKTDFGKITVEASREQILPDYDDIEFSSRIALTGQYALDLLYPVEEFRLGGVQFGRGYFNGRLSGDHGLGGSVELRANAPIDLPLIEETFKPQFYVFYDLGEVWSKEPGDLASQALASLGGGMRAQPFDGLSFELEVARPLTQTVIGSFNNEVHKPPVELYGRVTYTF